MIKSFIEFLSESFSRRMKDGGSFILLRASGISLKILVFPERVLFMTRIPKHNDFVDWFSLDTHGNFTAILPSLKESDVVHIIEELLDGIKILDPETRRVVGNRAEELLANPAFRKWWDSKRVVNMKTSKKLGI